MNIQKIQQLCQNNPHVPHFARPRKISFNAWDYYEDHAGRTILYVPADRIRSCASQRNKKPDRINKIAKEYIAQLYRGAVGYFHRNYVYLVDGQHSTDATVQYYGGNPLIPVTLVNKDCAYQLFILLNTSSRTANANDVFFAALTGREDRAVYVADFLAKNGITPKNGGKSEDGVTPVPGRIYGFLYQYGEDIFDLSISKLSTKFKGQRRSLEGTFLHGFFEFVSFNKDRKIRWSNIRKTSESLYQRGKVLNIGGSGSLYRGIHAALQEEESKK